MAKRRAQGINGGQRVAIYTRVSSTRQEDEGTSLTTQLERCRAHAKGQGWEIVGEYTDTHTGTDLHGREGLGDLRTALRGGAIDVVLCYAVDRLSRNQAHVYIIAEEIERRGARLAFVTEDFEQSAVGKFIRSAKAFAAEVEHEKIRERTVRGRRQRVESGKLLPGGKPLYGYRWRTVVEDVIRDGRVERVERVDKGALELDEAAAPIVHRIFDAITSGQTLRKITRDLTAEGVPTPTGRGASWSPSTVAQLLHKPAYKGDAYGWGWRKAGDVPQSFDPAKAIALPAGTIPPIVDAATWDAAQFVLARNKQRAIRSARNPEAALLRGGYVRCGYCGGAMYARPHSKGATEYVCKRATYYGDCRTHSIRANILDDVVWRRAKKLLKDRALIAREVERLREDDPTADDVAGVDRAIAETDRQQKNAAHTLSLIDDADARAPIVAHLKELSERRRRLVEERDRIEQRRAEWAKTQSGLITLEQWCARVAKGVETMNYDEKRMALDAFGFEIAVYGTERSPRWVIKNNIELVSSTT